MKKVRIAALVLLSLMVGHAHSQTDFFFNHYMLNPSYFNPAFVGEEENAFAIAQHRTQWAGYNPTIGTGSAPSTQLLSLNIPAKRVISGIGAVAINDRQNNLRSNQIRFQVALTRQLRAGVLSLGLSPAVNVQTIDPGDFISVDPEDFGTRQSEVKPNFHAGIRFQFNSRYIVGLSMENIVAPTFNLNGFDQLDYFERVVNVFVLREYALSRELKVIPSLLARTNPGSIANFTLDLSVLAYYQNKLWGGLAFKRSESLTALIGYAFLKDGKLKAGYSFDYVISEQAAKEPTSHEVFIRMDLPELIFGGRKAIKTPRFAF
ncbi:MAG: PorP/SprF family type IX secretion system membrane protein [Bacteroidota bacterium]